MIKTPSNNDNSSVSNDESKPEGFCLFQSTFGTACAIVLWITCMATHDCWTDCNDAVTKASILGFGIFVIFMLLVERAFEPDETLCDAMQGMGKEFDDVKTWFGKIGYLAYNITVFATLVAELNALLDTNTPMWYREQALYMYAFLMYSNAAGTKLWSILHTLTFALASDSIALAQSTQVIMNPRSIGLILGYCGMAYEIVQRRDDAAFLKDHLPVRSVLFFTLIWIPLFCTIWPFAETSMMNYLVIGICLLLCSADLSKVGKSDGSYSWMERSGAHLFHASIWSQIALVLLEYLEGSTGTRNLWIIGFLLYAHIGSINVTNICFVWGITVLGAMNTFGDGKGHFPFTTTVAVVRTVVMVLALVDLCLNGKKKDDEASKSDNEDEAQVKVLWDGSDATDYVPLVNVA
ncbi:unnamed protein product [Cylindrotheca closterium]|uniref:Uncharacterized protein n=1 Tax=Cylindrotheca closterium TaxID=2856 RepID=A0AAD2FMV3_9STRA|nr:unnamed protein product [Cylindrotheca closterium]